MKPRVRFSAWMLLACLAVFTGCSRKEKEVRLLPDIYKSYFNWHKGTYWVFRDAIDGSTDSISVVNRIHQIDPYYSDFQAEYIRYGLYVNPSGSPGPFTNWGFVVEHYYSTLYIDTGVIYRIANSSPFTLGPIPNSDPYDSKKTGVTTTYVGAHTINNHTYDSVYKTHFLYESKDLDDTIYFNRAVGFIHLVFNNRTRRQDLQLERYKVIR
jgi:hypothetical protein